MRDPPDLRPDSDSGGPDLHLGEVSPGAGRPCPADAHDIERVEEVDLWVTARPPPLLPNLPVGTRMLARPLGYFWALPLQREQKRNNVSSSGVVGDAREEENVPKSSRTTLPGMRGCPQGPRAGSYTARVWSSWPGGRHTGDRQGSTMHKDARHVSRGLKRRRVERIENEPLTKACTARGRRPTGGTRSESGV